MPPSIGDVNGLSPWDDVERLAAVLAGVLETGSSGLSQTQLRRLALRGAALSLPPVQAMQQFQGCLRAQGGTAAWNGLLHRRCLMSPSGAGDGAPGSSRCPEGLSVQRTVRAGWELIRVTAGGSPPSSPAAARPINRRRRGNSRSLRPDLIRHPMAGSTGSPMTTSSPGRRRAGTATRSISCLAGLPSSAWKPVPMTSWRTASCLVRSASRLPDLRPTSRFA